MEEEREDRGRRQSEIKMRILLTDFELAKTIRRVRRREVKCREIRRVGREGRRIGRKEGGMMKEEEEEGRKERGI
jgi:hypothetical protein